MNLVTSSLVVLCAFVPSVVPAPAGSKSWATPKPGSCDALYKEKCEALAKKFTEEYYGQESNDIPKLVHCIKEVKKKCKKDTGGVEILDYYLAILEHAANRFAPAPTESKSWATPKPGSCSALYRKKCDVLVNENAEQDFDQESKDIPKLVHCIKEVKKQCTKDTDGVQILNLMLARIEQETKRFVPAPAGSKSWATPKPGSCDALYKEKCEALAKKFTEEYYGQESNDIPKLVHCIKEVKKKCKKDTGGVEILDYYLAILEHAANRFAPAPTESQSWATPKPGSCSALYRKKCDALVNENAEQDFDQESKDIPKLVHCIKEVKKQCTKDTDGVQILNLMLARIEQETKRFVPVPARSKSSDTLKPDSCKAWFKKKCEALANKMKEQYFDQQCKDLPTLVHCVKEVKKQCKKDTEGVQILNLELGFLEIEAEKCKDLFKAEKEKDVKKKNKPTTTTYRRRGW